MVALPKISVTTLKPKRPINPQFKAPIKTSRAANFFNQSILFPPILLRHVEEGKNKTNCIAYFNICLLKLNGAQLIISKTYVD